MSWKQVTIAGVGLIGGSLALAMKRRGLAEAIVGLGHREASLRAARDLGAADRTSLDPAEAVADSDLVVLATPVGRFAGLLEAMAPALAPGAVVIDVGSTKARVVADAQSRMPAGRVFVGCHPIAGSENRGVDHARADLFEGELCIITPTEATPEEPLARVTQLWQALGMVVRVMSPPEHDRLLAEVSHLPHVAASVLVRSIGPEAEGCIGPGWVTTTRVASGDPALWCDILLSNRPEVAGALERLEAKLAEFRAALENDDADAVEGLLAEAKQRRDRLVREKGNR